MADEEKIVIRSEWQGADQTAAGAEKVSKSTEKVGTQAKETAVDLKVLAEELKKVKDQNLITREAIAFNTRALKQQRDAVWEDIAALKVLNSESIKSTQTGDKSYFRAMRSEFGDGSGGGGSKRSIASSAGGDAAAQLTKTLKGLVPFKALLQGFKFGGILDGLNQAVHGVNALGGAAVALTNNLAPMSSNIIAMPGLMVAAAQGMGVFKLATAGVGKTIKDLTSGTASVKTLANDMKNLPAPAREFALEVAKLHPQFQQLRTDVAGKFFKGLGGEIKTLSNQYMPMLRKQLGDTATVLNGTMHGVSSMLQNRQGQVGTILNGNNHIIKNVGRAATSGLGIGLTTLAAAQPYLQSMTGDVANLAEKLNKLASANTDKITRFFNNGYTRLKEWLHIIGQFGLGLYHVFQGATSWGNTMNHGITKAAEAFNKWSMSAKGKDSIAHFFANAQKDFGAIVHLVGSLGKAWASLSKGNSGSFVKDLNIISDKIVPALTKLVGHANGKFIPAILSIAQSFAKLLSAGGPGGLATFSVTLNIMSKALALIVAGFSKLKPGVQQGILAFAGILVVGFKVMKVFDDIKKFANDEKTLKKLASGLEGIGKAMAFLDANPIVLIIAAVIALAVGIWYLWNHCKPFHNFIVKMWKDIKQWSIDAWHVIDKVGRAIARIFMQVIRDIKKWAVDAWHIMNKVWRDIAKVIDWFKDHWKLTVTIIVAAFLPVVGALLYVAFHWKQIWGDIKDVVNTIWKWIYDNIIKPMIDFFTKTIPNALDALANGWDKVWNGIQSTIQTVWGVIKPILDTMKQAINDTVGAVKDVANVAGKIGSGVGKVLSWVNPLSEIGGPALAGVNTTVGERGPEFWANQFGQSMMVGLHGIETRKFPTPGYIFDAKATAGLGWPVAAPEWARKALEARRDRSLVTVAPRASFAAYPGAEVGHGPVPLPPVNFNGPIHVSSDFDLKQGIKRAIRQIETERTERALS